MSERNVTGCSLGSSEQADCAFCLAVVIEDLDPGNKWLSFGIGIDLPRELFRGDRGEQPEKSDKL